MLTSLIGHDETRGNGRCRDGACWRWPDVGPAQPVSSPPSASSDAAAQRGVGSGHSGRPHRRRHRQGRRPGRRTDEELRHPGHGRRHRSRRKDVVRQGFGVKDASKGDGPGNKVDADTVFQLASVSKSVGATVVAHEVTDNVVGWDMPVGVKLPWFALSDPYVTSHVTVADLYSHRSGLPDHAGDGLEDLGYDRAPGAGTAEVPAAGAVSNQLRLHQLRADRRRRGGRGRGGQAVGGPVRRGALPPAGHGLHQFAVRRLPGQAQPRGQPRQGRRQMGAALSHAIPTRSRPQAG